MANPIIQNAIADSDDNIIRAIANKKQLPETYNLNEVDMAALLASSTRQPNDILSGNNVLPCCGSAEQMQVMMKDVIERSYDIPGEIHVLMPVLYSFHWTLHQISVENGVITSLNVINSLGPKNYGSSTPEHYPFAEALIKNLPVKDDLHIQETRTGQQADANSGTCGDWAAWKCLGLVNKIPDGILKSHTDRSIRATTLTSINRMMEDDNIGEQALSMAAYDGVSHPLDKNAQVACDAILAEQFQKALNQGLDEAQAWSNAKTSRVFFNAVNMSIRTVADSSNEHPCIIS